jgi:phospholipid/cholesterol/gamma-HCH transport system ATP-binding protein
MASEPHRRDAAPPQAVPAVEFAGVSVSLDGRWILEDVSFSVAPGRILALLGPSGVGKTTCLRTLLGLLEPDAGEVLIEGRSLWAMRQDERKRVLRRFGVAFQGSGVFGSALFDSESVLGNVVHALRTLDETRLSEPELHRRARERLHEVGMLEHADRRPYDLSAGERKRVALARALVSDPEFVVLDSFDMGLDPVRRRGLRELIRRRHEQFGGTWLIATQDMEMARELSDDVVVLWQGSVTQAGPAAQVFGSERAVVRQLVTGEETGPITMGEAPAGVPRKIPTGPVELPPAFSPALSFPFLLACVTAGAIWLGGAEIWQLAILAPMWGALGMYLWRRYVVKPE